MGIHLGYLAIIIALLVGISAEARGRCSIAGSYFAGLYGMDRTCAAHQMTK